MTLNMPPNVSRDVIDRRRDVLVVDDDAGIRELILAYFSSVGMTAIGAEDGPVAIQALQRSRGRYDIVITDLNLPQADGFAVLHAARQANPSCYVIIVTGYASLDSAIQAVRVGAYDYLAKPFSLGQLDIVIRRITDRSALEHENRQLSMPAPVPASFLPSAVEIRVAAIEASLARIEAWLQKSADRPSEPTPGRLRSVGSPTLLTLSSRPSRT
jgi:DNA-binding NtrC family response regulator